MKLTVILEKTETGYSAYCKEIDGMITVGETFEEVKENFKEVLYMKADYESNGIASAEIKYFLDLND